MLPRIALASLGILVATATTAPAGGQAPSEDWSAVEQALGRKGAMQPGGVIKFGFPRGDLQVTVGGLAVKPTLALGSWAAFKRAGKGTVAMGDLVLVEDEVAPVMEKLQEGGVAVTALHNHLIGEAPHVLYMHFAAHGDASKIATAIHTALAVTKTPLAPPTAPSPAASIDLDTAQVAAILGASGKVNGGVYQVSVPRSERVMEGGMEIPPSMGVATAINIQPTGGGQAATTGDFVLLGTEVNPVIRALRENGIAVTAIHSHMLAETPRLFFMHFWATGDATKLARGLRAALDKTHVKRP